MFRINRKCIPYSRILLNRKTFDDNLGVIHNVTSNTRNTYYNLSFKCLLNKTDVSASKNLDNSCNVSSQQRDKRFYHNNILCQDPLQTCRNKSIMQTSIYNSEMNTNSVYLQVSCKRHFSESTKRKWPNIFGVDMNSEQVRGVVLAILSVAVMICVGLFSQSLTKPNHDIPPPKKKLEQ